jgi:uncharacterized protein
VNGLGDDYLCPEHGIDCNREMTMNLDPQLEMALKAAAFDTLLVHLRARTDVQNIDMMGLTGFCRNCLSEWLELAATARDVALSRDGAREIVYGMPYADYKKQQQGAATQEQLARMDASLLLNQQMRGW